MTTVHFKGQTSDPLEEVTRKKISRLEKHFDFITQIDITFTVENLSQIIDAQVSTSLPNTPPFHAQAKSNDMYTSIDDLIAKIDRQLSKHKDKLNSH